MSEEHNFLHHITGSFSQPAAENPTVEMVEAAYRHHAALPLSEHRVPPEKLADAVVGARAMNWPVSIVPSRTRSPSLNISMGSVNLLV